MNVTETVTEIFAWAFIIWTAIVIAGVVFVGVRAAVRAARLRRRMELLAWSRKSQAEYEDRWIAHLTAGCTSGCRGYYHEEA